MRPADAGVFGGCLRTGLLWALEGLARLQSRGRFSRPGIAADVERDFARLVNPLQAFLDECCNVSPTEKVTRDALWNEWRNWCRRTGHVDGSRELMGSRLRVLIPNLDQSRPKSADGGRRRVYVGVGLLSNIGISADG